MDYDDAYANAPYIDGAEHYPAKWADAARLWADAQAAQGLRLADLPYGKSARQRFDLFTPPTDPKGLFVFVHGGYWLKFDRSYWFHLAQGAVGRGWVAMLPSYDLCPQVRITEITRQIAAAISTAAQKVSGPIILAGHSAGGHLVARMLEPGLLPADLAERIRHVMPISPVSDLRPLMNTTMNAELRIDTDEALRESPVLMQNRLDSPVTVWVGAAERPAFLDQARWLAEAWGAGLVVEDGRHHFDVIDSLTDPDSPMTAALFR